MKIPAYVTNQILVGLGGADDQPCETQLRGLGTGDLQACDCNTGIEELIR